jgi:alpha-ketoglutarate-dependent taurine dioxygenase
MKTQTDNHASSVPSTTALENVQLRRLAKTFVLEISGLDLAQNLNDQLIRALQDLLAEHAVLVIRGQNLSDDQQDAFTMALGMQRDQREHVWAPEADPESRVGRHGALGPLPILNKGSQLFFVNGPELCEVDRDPNVILDMKDQYKMHGTSCWHTGDTEKANVEVVNILYPIIVPEREGHTEFADTAAAYAAMDAEARERAETLRVIHCMVFPEVEGIKMPDPTPPVSQPLVKQHAVTGKKYLYLNFHDMDRVVGWKREDSYAYIKALFAQTIRDPFIYTHKWQEGDLVVWNCNGTLHRRGLLDPTVKRALRRTQTVVPMLQSTRAWDRTQDVAEHEHDGTFWHPYPFKD